MERWSGTAASMPTDAAADALETTHVELLGTPGPAHAAIDPGPPAAPSSIVIRRFLGTVVVTVHGPLDITRAGQLGGILADLIDGQGNLSVTVDLHDATASDGDCLSVFVEAAERARRRGGRVRLNDPPEPIQEALQLRGVDQFVAAMLEQGAPLR